MIATITIESKKRYKRMVIAFALALSMFVGSAFALSPSYQNVVMSDSSGLVLLSLDDGSSSRSIDGGSGSYSVFNSSPIVFGGYSTSRSTYPSQTKYISSASISNNLQIYSQSSGSGSDSMYLSVPSGCYIDVCSSVSYPVSEYSDLVVSGGGYFYLASDILMQSSIRSYPDSVQILVNGSPVGDSFPCSSTGSFTLSDSIIAISSDVTTVGLRFLWTSADTVVSSSFTAPKSFYFRSYFSDAVVITPVVDDSLDYEPFFERVIAWEQSIFGAIQSLGDSLSESFGSVGESASRIASVFARDDDIQLRDDVDEAVTEVTDSFFTPAAEGETETEFDSATKIDKQKVTDVKQVAEGATALFDTGYEFTDGFEIIATDDSFLSWFTAETATALDSTGAVATVGDDDPYNMHFYYDHLQEIEVWKGD